MPPLTVDQKLQIQKILQRINRYKFTEEVIKKTIQNVECIRDGTYSLDDWFIPGIMSWLDYCIHWNLYPFIKQKYYEKSNKNT